VTANLDELLARARQHDLEAAHALADLVEERLLRRRGGDRQADHRRRRDEAIRAPARLTRNMANNCSGWISAVQDFPDS
jgi:hypothetical protein